MEDWSREYSAQRGRPAVPDHWTGRPGGSGAQPPLHLIHMVKVGRKFLQLHYSLSFNCGAGTVTELVEAELMHCAGYQSPQHALRVAKYPSIPISLWRHYDLLLSQRPQHRLVKAVIRQGEEKTWRAINEVVRLCGGATGLSPESLLARVGFNVRDLDEANFQAFLGVLRAINLFFNLGFSKILPLKPLKSRREADFLAERNGKRFAIEVFRFGEAVYRFPAHRKTSNNLTRSIESRCREKLPQIESTMLAHGCEAGIFAVVLDSYPAKALLDSAELYECLVDAFNFMGSPPKIHLLIFTGMQAIDHSDEYACFPEM